MKKKKKKEKEDEEEEGQEEDKEVDKNFKTRGGTQINEIPEDENVRAKKERRF